MGKEKEVTKQQKGVRKAFSIIASVLGIVIVIITLIVSIITISQSLSDENIPSLGKTMFFAIETDSMENSLMVGDLIVSKKFTGQELKVGDIITYKRTDKTLNTHRIVKVDTSTYTDPETGATIVQHSYTTMGDKRLVEYGDQFGTDLTDPAIFDLYYTTRDADGKWLMDRDDIINDSKVIAVQSKTWKGVGKVSLFLNNPDNNFMNYFLVVVLPLILLFAAYAFYFIKLIVQNSMAKKAKMATEESIAEMSDDERDALIAKLLAERAGTAKPEDKPADDVFPQEDAKADVKVEQAESPSVTVEKPASDDNVSDK